MRRLVIARARLQHILSGNGFALVFIRSLFKASTAGETLINLSSSHVPSLERFFSTAALHQEGLLSPVTARQERVFVGGRGYHCTTKQLLNVGRLAEIVLQNRNTQELVEGLRSAVICTGYRRCRPFQCLASVPE